MDLYIRDITWNEIYPIWRYKLWPDRTSAIETHSAMLYLEGFDNHTNFRVTFIGCFDNNKLLGVNSGHKTMDGGYRSRGLWVDPEHRGRGIGQMLLRQTIEFKDNATFVWSYPRQSSWNTYKAIGFQLASDWQTSETSLANAYCILT
jgi:GNAT superfamily N-acetyltransferase